jgi:hypothetical protein
MVTFSIMSKLLSRKSTAIMARIFNKSLWNSTEFISHLYRFFF